MKKISLIIMAVLIPVGILAQNLFIERVQIMLDRADARMREPEFQRRLIAAQNSVFAQAQRDVCEATDGIFLMTEGVETAGCLCPGGRAPRREAIFMGREMVVVEMCLECADGWYSFINTTPHTDAYRDGSIRFSPEDVEAGMLRLNPSMGRLTCTEMCWNLFSCLRHDTQTEFRIEMLYNDRAEAVLQYDNLFETTREIRRFDAEFCGTLDTALAKIRRFEPNVMNDWDCVPWTAGAEQQFGCQAITADGRRELTYAVGMRGGICFIEFLGYWDLPPPQPEPFVMTLASVVTEEVVEVPEPLPAPPVPVVQVEESVLVITPAEAQEPVISGTPVRSVGTGTAYLIRTSVPGRLAQFTQTLSHRAGTRQGIRADRGGALSWMVVGAGEFRSGSGRSAGWVVGFDYLPCSPRYRGMFMEYGNSPMYSVCDGAVWRGAGGEMDALIMGAGMRGISCNGGSWGRAEVRMVNPINSPEMNAFISRPRFRLDEPRCF